MQDSFNRTQANQMLKQHGADLKAISESNSLMPIHRQQARVILSALNSIVYDSKRFQPESIEGVTIDDPSTAIRTLVGSDSFATAARLENLNRAEGTPKFNIEGLKAACGLVTEPKKSQTDIEIATTKAIANICANATSPEGFGASMYNIIIGYLQDVDVDSNKPEIQSALSNLADKSEKAYEQYMQNKNDMGPIDQLIDFVKSIFGMDIDSKFLESATKALGEATVEANLPEDKVFGKHTAAVLAERGGQSKGGGITGP